MRTKSVAVFLSLVYPEDDKELLNELKLLGSLSGKIKIIIGGRSAKAYYNRLKDSNIQFVNNLKQAISLF